MGQHCSCFTERQRRKSQHRSSDDYTMDSESWSTTEEDGFDVDVHNHVQEAIESVEENQGLLRAIERLSYHDNMLFNRNESIRPSSICVELKTRDCESEGRKCELTETLRDNVVLNLADILRNYQEATGVVREGLAAYFRHRLYSVDIYV